MMLGTTNIKKIVPWDAWYTSVSPLPPVHISTGLYNGNDAFKAC